MILRITRHCSMGCSHCMVDCRPDGRHMTAEVFSAAQEFIAATVPLVLLVTGGEPLEHPQADAFVAKTIELLSPQQVLLCTNGEHLTKERAERLGCSIQVVNDRRYYPRFVPPVDAPNVMHFDTIPTVIYPVGRAVGQDSSRLSPSCFNLRSIVGHSGYEFTVAVKMLEMRGKYCTPVIDWDGSILLGETCGCQPVGTVFDDPQELAERIRSFTCKNCGLDKNLSAEHRAIVWR